MLTTATIKNIIKHYKLAVTPAALKAAQEKGKKTNKEAIEVLIADGAVNEEKFFAQAAEFLKVPLVTLRGKEIKKEVLNLIPRGRKFSTERELFPLAVQKGE